MTLRHDIGGQGPDLLLFHGWAMHSGIFAPVLPALRRHFRVHCIDLPGHGHSIGSSLPLDFETVWQFLLPRLGQPAHVMGWSLGGLFALHGAIHHPKHCRSLIMQNASPCFVQRPDWPQGMPAQVFHQFAEDLHGDYERTLQRFFMLEAQGSEHLRAELRLLQKTAFEFGRPDPHVLGVGLHLLESTDMRSALPELRVPSLWLAGRRDRLVNPLAMQQACAQAGGEYACDEHGGHAPFLTHPENTLQALAAFTETAHECP
jgi:pimeloyl-[acyl-carrier protein] methyl ester esterase